MTSLTYTYTETKKATQRTLARKRALRLRPHRGVAGRRRAEPRR